MRSPGLFSLVVPVLVLGCASEPIVRESAGEWPGTVKGPAGSGRGVRVFTGTAATLNDGEACTSEKGMKGDRWCGFVALAESGAHNLFVVNVSQVIAGVSVTCDGSDPNCLLLTEDVQGSGANWHPTFFAGDTLVYYDATITPYAWRPGLDRGRLLMERESGYDVVFCTPAPRGTGVVCMNLPNEQPDTRVVAAELYAGSVDAESEPLLAPLDAVIAGNQGDNLQRFSYGFPADGYIAWTTRDYPDGPELLKTELIGDPTSEYLVATDVHDWNISADGTEWLWRSATDARGVGLLQVAPFPDGSYPSDVLADVSDYFVDRQGALVAQTAGADLVSIADPVGAPDGQLLVDHGVQRLVGLSEQGHVAYAKHLVGTAVADLFVSKRDGSDACWLDSDVSVPLNSVHFAPGAEAAVWARETIDGYDAYHTRLDDCSTVPLAPNVVVLGWIGRGTTIFMDEFDASKSSGSMRFRNIAKNGMLDPAPPTLIAEHIDTEATWGPALIYTVNAGDDEDGVFVRAFAQ